MRTIMLWTLIVPGPRPYAIDTYPTHAQCVQARYEFGRTVSTGRPGSQPRSNLVCRPIPSTRP